MFWLKSCPRCHGDLHEIRDVGYTYISCIQCGRILSDEQERALPRLVRQRVQAYRASPRVAAKVAA